MHKPAFTGAGAAILSRTRLVQLQRIRASLYHTSPTDRRGQPRPLEFPIDLMAEGQPLPGEHLFQLRKT